MSSECLLKTLLASVSLLSPLTPLRPLVPSQNLDPQAIQSLRTGVNPMQTSAGPSLPETEAEVPSGTESTRTSSRCVPTECQASLKDWSTEYASEPPTRSETPGEPIDFQISEIGKTFCFLKWKKPDYDGGSRNLAYHVEKKPKEAEEWERIHKGAIKETYFMADRCIENQIYQFRVQTKNEGGESNWVTTAEVLVKEQLVEPEVKIKLDGTLVVKAGDSIPIEAMVKGKPQPDVKWTKDEGTEEIRKGPRLQIETGADFSKLLVTGARRTDSGKYVVTASNSAGTCAAHATVNVLDRPGPIRDLKVSGITIDRCILTWEVPEDNGGCDIYNYIIEKCETKRGVWSVHSNAVITNKANVTRLIEGNEYIFRVRAENKMGPGPEILEAPEIDLDANLKQGLTVRAGCPIRLCATIRGRPPPKVTWRRMGIDNVVRKGKVDIIDTMTFLSGNMCVLIIKDVSRTDSGEYSLVAENSSAKVSQALKIIIRGQCPTQHDHMGKTNEFTHS
uniref:Uncharacterized protein n=1 Tax=Stegastes partitus TaxID=144197 RepID=A0A3B5A5D0_9TELE